MTLEVRAHTATGQHLHTYQAPSIDAARAYCVAQSAAPFVDGYLIEGIGIVRVVRDTGGHPTGFRRLLDGEFIEGGPELISLPVRRPSARCPECGRVFDLANEADANEWHYGHDCEC